MARHISVTYQRSGVAEELLRPTLVHVNAHCYRKYSGSSFGQRKGKSEDGTRWGATGKLMTGCQFAITGHSN